MPVRVLFFGATADIAGKRDIEIDAAGSKTSRDIFDQVVSRFPRLESHRLLYSVNQQYASGDEIVRDGDELGIFTAVSGG